MIPIKNAVAISLFGLTLAVVSLASQQWHKSEILSLEASKHDRLELHVMTETKSFVFKLKWNATARHYDSYLAVRNDATGKELTRQEGTYRPEAGLEVISESESVFQSAAVPAKAFSWGDWDFFSLETSTGAWQFSSQMRDRFPGILQFRRAFRSTFVGKLFISNGLHLIQAPLEAQMAAPDTSGQH